MDGDPMCDLKFVFNSNYEDFTEIYIEYKIGTIRNGQQIVQEYIK